MIVAMRLESMLLPDPGGPIKSNIFYNNPQSAYDEEMKPLAFSYLRFSTPEQALGDSERRQIEAAEQWAKKKGIKLDKSYADRGRSGFKGTNRKKGALGKFLKRITAGEIPRGSYLVVEDLDRLSREHPMDSLTLVRNIISAGVTIAVLKGNEEYSDEVLRADRSGIKMMALVFELGRASGESARKADLGSKNWSQKRKQAAEHGRVMTEIAPAWIGTTGEKENRRFVLIEDRAEIVRQIFKWHLQGTGNRTIAQKLNDGKIPNWGRGKRAATHWHPSYIQKILHNPGVIGELHPHKLEYVPDPTNASEQIQISKPTGEIFKDYYPAVVDLDTYQRVQTTNRHPSRGNHGGRIQKFVSNLFPSLTFGTLKDPTASIPDPDEPAPPPTVLVPARYKSKGSHGHGQYLVAEVDAVNKKRKWKDEIEPARWPYPAVEFAILKTLREIDWNAVAGHGNSPAQTAFASRVAAIERTADELRVKCENLADVIANTPLPSLVRKLAELEEERKEAKANATEARKELADSEISKRGLAVPLSIKDAAHDPTARDIRLALRAEIARRIKSIQISPKVLVPKKDHRDRITHAHSFQIAIFFVNGASRFIRVTLNKGKEPTIQSVNFQEKGKWKSLKLTSNENENSQ